MASDAEKLQLETERELGAKAKGAWDSMIGPFFHEKEAVLIEAFRVCGLRDNEGLIKIKMQFSAIDALKAELLGYMETGKLADISLNEIEKADKPKKEKIDD